MLVFVTIVLTTATVVYLSSRGVRSDGMHELGLEQMGEHIYRRMLPGGEMRVSGAEPYRVRVTPHVPNDCTLVRWCDDTLAPLGDVDFDQAYRVKGSRLLAYARFPSAIRDDIMFNGVSIENGVVECTVPSIDRDRLRMLEEIFAATLLTAEDAVNLVAVHFANEPVGGVRLAIARVLEREAPQSDAYRRVIASACEDVAPEIRLFARARVAPSRLAQMALDSALSWPLRDAVLREMQQRGCLEALREMLPALDHGEGRVIVAKLARMLPALSLLPRVKQWALDPESPPSLVAEALESIMEMEIEREAFLLQLLATRHAKLRAIEKLGRFGSAASTAALEALTELPETKRAARQALAQILARLPANLNGAVAVANPLAGAVSERED